MPRRVNKAIGDAMVHPVRLQILRSFELNGAQTINDVATALPELPQASLYRHIKILSDAGALKIRETLHGGRGAPERVYELPDAPPVTIALKGKARTREALRAYYLALIAAQTAEFERAVTEGVFPEKYFAARHSLIRVNARELEEVHALFRRLAEFSDNPAKGRIELNLGLAMFPARKR